MRRIIPAIFLIVVLFIGGGIIANTAYQAGVTAAVTSAGGATTVVVPAGYGWGFGAGFGFFGFIGALLFLFIVFGLIRAVFFGMGHRSHSGGGWSPEMRDKVRGRWETGAHETFDDWHKRAHDGPTPPPS